MLCAIPPASAAERNCADLNTQLEINVCQAERFDKADAALNAAYAKLAAKVSPQGKTQLVEAQRAWIKYRDAQCAFETLGTIGGSINPMEVAICRAELTKEQTKRLQRQIDCVEGDLSCGGQ
ncbi:MAG: hypothetical protein CTY15_14245 [Methylocystis sp.]|nr:MAG: hypothetical protein CTY15_14245 [Methylocystis sp.]